MRNRDNTNIKGLLRPHLDVHKSDQCPIVGTVNSAINGAENRKKMRLIYKAKIVKHS